MDRRQFVTAAASTSALAALPGRALAQGTGGDAALNAIFTKTVMQSITRSPEFATFAGLDKGPNAALKSQLSPRTAARREEDLGIARGILAELKAIDPATLTDANKLNRDVVIYQTETRMTAAAKFGLGGVQRPYVIMQQDGAYFNVPDFLSSSHTIATAPDAEAYLSRLSAFSKALDEDSTEQKAQAARGYLAPGWSIDLSVGQMEKLRNVSGADSSMTKSLVDRAAAKGIAGDWGPRAAKIIEGEVYPALDRQIALMKALRPTTRSGDGAQRLPRGGEIYAAALEQATTTNMSPEEVHKVGLDLVADYSGQLDAFLKTQGLTKGTVGARVAAFNVRPDQLYPDTAAGRLQLIADLNKQVQAMYAKLPQAFSHTPKASLEIRAVPVEIQDGASNGYYKSASLDGSRPAIYFINLKDVGDWPKYGLPTLSFHEGVPGHHLQIATAQESGDIPLIRKFGGFSAYSEGWALYAEQLADELGFYQGDPLGHAGMIQSYLFRAARLVIDTSLHTKNWSREQATQYMVETTGFAKARSQREVERYCTQMGQACSYKIGHLAWIRARDKSKATLGSKFDLKKFHDVLKDGAMPLTILEARVEERTRAMMV
ncbi:Tat pathway signal protein [Sphingomonas antarctica]|uniref:DUF885 domain-containing protein n=1 Tax=Sphingomonas antarctica TaxID=2040274 RepID=UPI0039EC069D